MPFLIHSRQPADTLCQPRRVHRRKESGIRNLKSGILLLILSFAIRHSANAAVIYSGPQNIAIPTTFDGIYLDLDTGTTSTSTITGWDVNFFFGGVGIGSSAAFQPSRLGTGNMDTIRLHELYDLIDDTLLFSTGETGSSDHLGAPGNFQDGVEGYLGFQFTKNDLSGPFYGYMRLTLTANTSGAMIHDWAWDDTGGFLTIPEPSRAILAFAGLSAMLMRRRRFHSKNGGFDQLTAPAIRPSKSGRDRCREHRDRG